MQHNLLTSYRRAVRAIARSNAAFDVTMLSAPLQPLITILPVLWFEKNITSDINHDLLSYYVLAALNLTTTIMLALFFIRFMRDIVHYEEYPLHHNKAHNNVNAILNNGISSSSVQYLYTRLT